LIIKKKLYKWIAKTYGEELFLLERNFDEELEV